MYRTLSSIDDKSKIDVDMPSGMCMSYDTYNRLKGYSSTHSQSLTVERDYRKLQAEFATLKEKQNEEKKHYQTLQKIKQQEIDALRAQANGEAVELPKNKECQLCFDREITATFTCGHTCCYECGLQTLECINACPFCKEPRVKLIKLYL